MMCARCDQPIPADEESTPIDAFSASGPGSTVYVHKVLCEQPPTQTAPAPAIGSRRHR